MGRCKAWLNGKVVGTASWDAVTKHIIVRCTLPEGWIYRAVLLLGEREIANFGVLLPGKDGFSAELQATSIDLLDDTLVRCEVLRSKPGETSANDGFLAFSQFSRWDETAFALEPVVALQIKRKRDVFYRIYNQKRYLMLKLDHIESDSAVIIYAIGKPIEIENQWYLYLRIDDNGKPIPWATDEK